MPVMVQTTCASQDEARAMARAAVEQNLCACAHIDEIESIYAWKGEVINGAEWRVIFKTRGDLFEALSAMIRSMHSYELPAISATAITRITPDYAVWVKDSTAR